MKKLIICAAVVLAAGLMTTSCKDTNRCWEITYKVGPISFTTHVWGTQNELDATIAELKEKLGEDLADLTYEYTTKAQSECHD